MFVHEQNTSGTSYIVLHKTKTKKKTKNKMNQNFFLRKNKKRGRIKNRNKKINKKTPMENGIDF